MKTLRLSAWTAAVIIFVAGQGQAVELLVSGDFEIPQGQAEVQGWELEKFVTGDPDAVLNTAQLVGNGEGGTDRRLRLNAFAGGSGFSAEQGNFVNAPSPFGSVTGDDFNAWQRGNSPTPLSVEDLTAWQENYGGVGGRLTNAILSQTVPATPGTEYTFSAFAAWEDNYAGGVETLDPSSPLGAAPSPTTNAIRIEFLDAGGSELLTAEIDLAENGQFNDPFIWIQHSVTETAPANTASVRVSADARDMIFNTDPLQAAFYDTFSLTDTSDPGAELLENPGVDIPDPSALDFWEIFEIPAGCCGGNVLRSNSGQLFANHTAGGQRGVWLSAFFGAHPIFEADPVTGLMSQTVPAVAGGTYDFSGWAKFEQNYSGGVDTIDAGGPGFFAGQESPTDTVIVLEFLDSNGDPIEQIIDFDPSGVTIDTSHPNVIEVRPERQAQCAGNANDESCGPGGDGWTQHSLTGVIAPAGTVEARLTAGMINGVFNIDPRQSAFFDDFSLQEVSTPASAGAAQVPEPASVLGLACGAMVVILRRGRRRLDC